MPSHIPSVLNPRDGKTYASREQLDETIASLRAAADFLESTELPIPVQSLWSLRGSIHISASSYQGTDPDFVARPGHISKLIGGKVEKGLLWSWDPNSDFVLTRKLAGSATVRFVFDRASVCTPREVEKTVTEEVPDPEKVKTLNEAIEALEKQRDEVPTTTVSKTETVVEYDCPPSLLEMDKAAREAAEKHRASHESELAF